MMNYYFNVESIINLASLATRFVEKPHEDRYVKAINELKGKESERSSVDKLIETILSDQDLSPREKADLINTVETQYYNRKVEYTKYCADIIDKGMEKKITRVLAFVGGVVALGGATYAIGSGIHNYTNQLRIEPNPK